MADPLNIFHVIGVASGVSLGALGLGLYAWYRHEASQDDLEARHIAKSGLSASEFRAGQDRLADAAAWTDAVMAAAGRGFSGWSDRRLADDMLCRGISSRSVRARAYGYDFAKLMRDRAVGLAGWDFSSSGVPFSPYVAGLMLDEAIEAGRYDLLPEFLQGEYHERTGDGIVWAAGWLPDEVRAEAQRIYDEKRAGRDE